MQHHVLYAAMLSKMFRCSSIDVRDAESLMKRVNLSPMSLNPNPQPPNRAVWHRPGCRIVNAASHRSMAGCAGVQARPCL